jgi:hypothetical protein
MQNEEFRMKDFNSAFRILHSAFHVAVYFLLHFPFPQVHVAPEGGMVGSGGR